MYLVYTCTHECMYLCMNGSRQENSIKSLKRTCSRPSRICEKKGKNNINSEYILEKFVTVLFGGIFSAKCVYKLLPSAK